MERHQPRFVEEGGDSGGRGTYAAFCAADPPRFAVVDARWPRLGVGGRARYPPPRVRFGWLERIARTRSVRLTADGEHGLREHFGLRPPAC